MMVRKNFFRVRKPYERIIDGMIEDGKIMLPTKYKTWLYLTRKQKKTNAFKIKNIDNVLCVIQPTRKMKKNKHRSVSKHYSYYEIL